MRLVVLAMTLAVNAAPLPAADRDGLWQGTGGVDCTTFIENRDAGRDNAYQWWLLGWVAAHNKLLDRTYALIADEAEFRRSMDWLDRFCRDHRSLTLIDAAESLIELELYPMRLQARPR